MLFLRLRLRLPRSCLLPSVFFEWNFVIILRMSHACYIPRLSLPSAVSTQASCSLFFRRVRLRVTQIKHPQYHRNIPFRKLELVLFTSEPQIQSTHTKIGLQLDLTSFISVKKTQWHQNVYLHRIQIWFSTEGSNSDSERSVARSNVPLMNGDIEQAWQNNYSISECSNCLQNLMSGQFRRSAALFRTVFELPINLPQRQSIGSTYPISTLSYWERKLCR
jgi:hypothetical protein